MSCLPAFSKADKEEGSSTLAHVFLLYFLFFVLRFMISLYFDEPYIMGDELVYKTMALSFLKTAKFNSVQFANVGVSLNFPNVLYQMVISWSFLLKNNFYVAIKLTNSLISNMAIFPLYLIGRMHMPHGRSLLAAVVVMLLPEMTYVNNVMPENLYFPLFFAAVYLILSAEDRESRGVSCLAGVSLGLLYLSKPHAIAVIISEILWAVVVLISRIKRKDRTGAFVSRVVMMNASAFLIIFVARYFRSGLEWGLYSEILGRASALEVKPLIQYVMALLTSIFFIFGVPIIITVRSLWPHNDEQQRRTSRLSLLALLMLISMFAMTVMYTTKIAPQEHFHRLHERYFYYALGLIMIVSFAAVHKVKLRYFEMFIYAAAIIGNAVLWKQFFYDPVVLPYGLNFNHDYLMYSWAAVLPKRLVLVLILAVMCMSFFMLFRRSYFKTVVALWSFFYIFANVSLVYGLNRVQYRVVSEIEKERIFLQSCIPDKNSHIMLIDSSHVRRTNVAFWLNYHYVDSQTIPAGTIIHKSQIPAATDYLVLLDQYPLDFDPVKMYHDSLITVNLMVREDMRRLLNGLYQDYWTKKEFAFESPSKFRTLRIDLSDWQPSYPNKLEIKTEKEKFTYDLDGSKRTVLLPYAKQYRFMLAKTWNPKKSGLNNDDRDLGLSIKKVEIIP